MRGARTIPEYGDTNFITGMRAYAALAVVMIHSGGAGLKSLGEVGLRIVALGQAGVYAFFVISGFSVASALASRPTFTEYMSRRLLRIAPLYFFWLAASVFEMYASGMQMTPPADAYNWLMHLSFLSFLDARIANSLISVEWSIPIEVFWYLALPAIHRRVMAARYGTAIAIVGSFAIYWLVQRTVERLVAGDAALASHTLLALHYSPVPYVFAYCLGVSAFKIRRNHALLQSFAPALPLILGLTALYAISAHAQERIDPYEFFSLATFAIIVTGSNTGIGFRMFNNRVALFLGAVSYGIYLAHVPVSFLLRKAAGVTVDGLPWFLVVVAATTAVAAALFVLIERPAQKLGRQLFRRSPLAPAPAA